MTTDLFFGSLLEWTRVLAQTCIADLWQGLVLMAAVALGLRLFKGAEANTRFALCALLFLAGIALSLGHLFQGQDASAATRSSALLQVGVLWCPLLAATWALLLVVRATRLLRQGWYLRGLWQRAMPIEAGNEVAELLRQCGRSGRARLCTSAEVASPCVIGFRSPRLLLPETLRGSLSEQELRQIVLHECEHLRRGDDWINLLQKIGLMFFPLHPVLLWMDRRMSLERELACDAGVVQAMGKPIAYAGCLARLAEHRLRSRTLALSLAAWGRGSELTQRVSTLLGPRRAPQRGGARIAFAALSVALVAGTAAMEKVPSLIEFGSSSPSRRVAEGRSLAQVRAAQGHMVPVAYHLPANRLPAETQDAAVSAVAGKRNARRGRPELRQAQRHPASAQAGNWTADRLRERTPATARPATPEATEVLTRYAAIPFGDGWLVFQL